MNPPAGLAFPVLLLYRLAEAAILAVHEHFTVPGRPGRPLDPVLVRETAVGLVYQFPLPPPHPDTIDDVRLRRLAVSVNGADRAPIEVAFDPNAADNPVPEGEFQQGDEVTVALIDVDDAGNSSPPSPPYSFTAADTLPPSAPDQPSAVLVRETP